MKNLLFHHSGGIRRKISGLIFLLVLAITTGSTLAVLRLMESNLHGELIRRGEAISLSMGTPAAFSLLSDDRLALDNLVARLASSQEDIVFAAVIGAGGEVLAHSDLSRIGWPHPPAQGDIVAREADFTVRREVRQGRSLLEFRMPISFAGKELGEVSLGLSTEGLEAAVAQARRRTLLLAGAALVLGLAGAAWLSRVITLPIQHLSTGVGRLRSGTMDGEVPVLGEDELGSLTRSFNAMAGEITRQRASLSAHARELEEAYVSTIRLLAAAIDARDEYTLGHSSRVANLSVQLGRRLGYGEDELRDLAVSCFLHDVGKIRIPDRILNKRGPLSRREHEAILRHPEHGADILRLAGSLHRYIPAVLHHHEWYNGEGYPAGLQGEDIPEHAAIVALADAFDAMVIARPYRPALSRDEAVAELRRCGGAQFSPRLVDLFIESLEDEEPESAANLIAGVA